MSVNIPNDGAAAAAGDPCAYAVDAFCARWKPMLLRASGEDGKTRFSRFTRQLPISEKVLAQKLRELEDDGLIRRERSDGPDVRVEYSLTELGRSVLPMIESLYNWGWHEMRRRGLEIDPLGEMWYGYRERDEELMDSPYGQKSGEGNA